MALAAGDVMIAVAAMVGRGGPGVATTTRPVSFAGSGAIGLVVASRPALAAGSTALSAGAATAADTTAGVIVLLNTLAKPVPLAPAAASFEEINRSGRVTA